MSCRADDPESFSVGGCRPLYGGREVESGVSIVGVMSDRTVSVECVFRSAASCYLHTSIAIFAFVRSADLSRSERAALEMEEAQTNVGTQD